METKITYTITTIWKDRRRASHKEHSIIIPRDLSESDRYTQKYWLLAYIDDGKLNEDMVTINKVEVKEN